VPPVSFEHSLGKVHELILRRLGHKRIRLYEAGGGSASFMPREILAASDVTVLDIDSTQLANNQYAAHKILGDLQSFSFPPDSFDLIVCYNVIEHLDSPDRAVDLFFRALSPGGLLLIGAPNAASLTGWITKVTPHWFHVWYYRHVLGYTTAGLPGYVPFKTIYHPIISPKRLIAYCERLGFKLDYFCEYEGDLLRRLSEKLPLAGQVLNGTIRVANKFRADGKDLANGDFHAVFLKPEG
jgi:SAM-dependent methyltransferase